MQLPRGCSATSIEELSPDSLQVQIGIPLLAVCVAYQVHKLGRKLDHKSSIKPPGVLFHFPGPRGGLYRWGTYFNTKIKRSKLTFFPG